MSVYTKTNVNRKGLTAKQLARMPKGWVYGIAEAVRDGTFFAKDPGGALYVFRNGVYVRGAEPFIRSEVWDTYAEMGQLSEWKNHVANEVVEYIRASAPSLWELPPEDEINVANGIIHLSSRKLLPHTPDFLSTIQLPIAYDVEATCPSWEKFIAEVFPYDSQQTAWEMLAWLMVPRNHIQSALFLIGEGSNGKSTWLRALTAFLGSTNVSALSLHKLETDRFATSRLIGKLANICPDLPNKRLENTSVLKAITGGDAIPAEYKHRDSFDFRLFAKLIFAANALPYSGDGSEGFFRRPIIIPFTKTFTPDPAKGRELDAALAQPSELSGALNNALTVLLRVLASGITVRETMRRAMEEYRRQSDPLAVWLGEEIEDDPQGEIPKAALQGAYEQYCQQNGRIPPTQQSFGRALKRLRPGIKEGQRGSHKVRVYKGIRFRDESIHAFH